MSGEFSAKVLLSNFPTSLTGARPGETLAGVPGKLTEGSLAQVSEQSALVPPVKRDLDVIRNEGIETWQKFLKRLGGIAFFAEQSLEEREAWLEKHQQTNGGQMSFRDMSSDAHAQVQLRIQQFGNKFLSKMDDARANEILSESAPGQTTRAIADAFGRRTLFFLKDYWTVVSNYSTSRDYGTEPDFVAYNIENGQLVTRRGGPGDQEGLIAYNVMIDHSSKRRAVFLVSASKRPGLGEREGLELAWTMLSRQFDGQRAPMDRETFVERYAQFKTQVLSAFTPAGLKSLLQKLIRFAPKSVEVPFQPKEDSLTFRMESIMPEIVLCWTMVALLNSPGSFVPDIQRFVRGLESFAKRLAVIAYEDAYVATSEIVLSLSAAALLSQRVKSWTPSRGVVASWFLFGIQALSTTRTTRADMQRGLRAERIPLASIASIARDSPEQARLYAVSALLDEVKSFAGDLALARDVALHYPEYKSNPRDKIARPASMPIWHAIDQHWYADLVYAMPVELVESMSHDAPKSKPFSIVLEQVFEQVTGLNPRKQHISPEYFSPESNAFAAAVREAQELVFRALLPKSVNRARVECMPLVSGERYTLRYTLDYSWIAGLVGGIEVRVGRQAYIVSLKPDEPFELVVIPKPSRKTRDSLDDLTPEIEDQARAKARAILEQGIDLSAIPAPYPLLKGARAKLVGWSAGDPRFSVTLAREKRVAFETASASIVSDKLRVLEKKRALIQKRIQELREQSQARIKLLERYKQALATTNLEIARLSGAPDALPPFKLAGAKKRKAAKQEDNLQLDWDQARRYAGEFPLLESVEALNLREFVTRDCPREFVGRTHDAGTALAELIERTPPMHLRRAINILSGYLYSVQMPRVSRDGGGTEMAVQVADVGAFQFLATLSLLYPIALSRRNRTLVSFDVRSPLALWRMRDLIVEQSGANQWRDQGPPESWGAESRTVPRAPVERVPWPHQIESTREMLSKRSKGNFLWIPTGMGKTAIILSYIVEKIARSECPPCVVYVLPDSALETVVAEIRAYNFKLVLLWPLKTKAPASITTVPGCVPREFHINLVRQDDVRKCPELLGYMPEALLIYDEVHLAMAAGTLRTRGALELSKASADFIALTATPIVDNRITSLQAWLEQIVRFPITERNIFTAASSMVAKKVTTGVQVRERVLSAPFSDAEAQRLRDLLPVALGGANTYASIEDLLEANEIAYAAATRLLIEQTLEQLRYGGVMLVAKDKRHQQDMLERLLSASSSLERSDVFLVGPEGSIYLTDASVRASSVPPYRVVITTKDRAEGYSLTYLKSMIRGVYPSNQAKRIQIEGRIDRIDQVGIDPKRDAQGTVLEKGHINFVTIYAGELQKTLLENHSDAKNLLLALRALAQQVQLEQKMNV